MATDHRQDKGVTISITLHVNLYLHGENKINKDQNLLQPVDKPRIS